MEQETFNFCLIILSSIWTAIAIVILRPKVDRSFFMSKRDKAIIKAVTNVIGSRYGHRGQFIAKRINEQRELGIEIKRHTTLFEKQSYTKSWYLQQERFLLKLYKAVYGHDPRPITEEGDYPDYDKIVSIKPLDLDDKAITK